MVSAICQRDGTSWQKTDLTGSIAPGGYYLIQEAQGTGGVVDLPAPDVIAASPIALSATAGKVVLLNSSTLVPSGPSCPKANRSSSLRKVKLS